MYANLQSLPELCNVSVPSCALLERSVLELQIRIQEAEERLARFNFDDMWPESTKQPCPGRANYHHCGQFFRRFYEKHYKRWPPKKTQNSNGGWLTRGIASPLQRDFSALYDYHVDRDIIWDERKEPRERHRNIIRKTDKMIVETTNDDPWLAEVFCFFDREHRYPHIPHPYPLLPDPGPRQIRIKKDPFREQEQSSREAYQSSIFRLIQRPYLTFGYQLESFSRSICAVREDRCAR